MSWASVIILIGPAVLAAKSKAAAFHGRPDFFSYPLIILFQTFYKNSAQSHSVWDIYISSCSQQLIWFHQK